MIDIMYYYWEDLIKTHTSEVRSQELQNACLK